MGACFCTEGHAVLQAPDSGFVCVCVCVWRGYQLLPSALAGGLGLRCWSVLGAGLPRVSPEEREGCATLDGDNVPFTSSSPRAESWTCWRKSLPILGRARQPWSQGRPLSCCAQGMLGVGGALEKDKLGTWWPGSGLPLLLDRLAPLQEGVGGRPGFVSLRMGWNI